MSDLHFESDVALGARCMDVLVKHVGLLETERFIAYLSREQSDYTKWRQDQFEDLSLEDLGKATRESGKFVRRVRSVEAVIKKQ